MWDKTTIRIKAKPRSKHQLRYTYAGPEHISRVETSCGCSVASIQNQRSVTVTYTAPDFPEHMRILGKAEVQDQKKITVTMSNGSKQLLYIDVTLEKA